MKRSVPFLFLVFAVAACGDDGRNASDTTDTRDTADTAVDAPETSGCTPLAKADLEPLRFDLQDDVHTSYSLALKVGIGVPAADYLVLQFYNYNERIDAGAGTFALDAAPNDNFGTCPECIALWIDQADPSLPPGKILFQSSGSIRLDVDPRTRRLIGRLEGVVFREIALDPETLASTFVPDGDCAELTEPLDFDLVYVPPEWTCGAASYYTSDGCDCDCGAVDPDCYPSFDTPLTVSSTDCAEGEVCVYEKCTAFCDVGVGGGTRERCAEGEVCTFALPKDLCSTDPVDAAEVGETCTSYATYCAVSDGIPGGACAIQEGGPGACKPLCASGADCGGDQHCFSLVSYDEPGKGYCEDGPAPE